MNKQRRKAIQAIRDKIDGLYADLEELMDEEQEYLDNMPSSMQFGDKGSEVQEKIDAIGEAREALESANDRLDDAMS